MFPLVLAQDALDNRCHLQAVRLGGALNMIPLQCSLQQMLVLVLQILPLEPGGLGHGQRWSILVSPRNLGFWSGTVPSLSPPLQHGLQHVILSFLQTFKLFPLRADYQGYDGISTPCTNVLPPVTQQANF